MIRAAFQYSVFLFSPPSSVSFFFSPALAVEADAIASHVLAEELDRLKAVEARGGTCEVSVCQGTYVSRVVSLHTGERLHMMTVESSLPVAKHLLLSQSKLGVQAGRLYRPHSSPYNPVVDQRKPWQGAECLERVARTSAFELSSSQFGIFQILTWPSTRASKVQCLPDHTKIVLSPPPAVAKRFPEG